MKPAHTSLAAGLEPLQEASFYYRDRVLGQPAVRVLPGEFYVHGSDALMVVTTLGSCVAACLLDPQARLAGMNHFMLPHAGGSDDRGGERVGVHAMQVLIGQMLQRGAHRQRLQARIFGGACVAGGLPAGLAGPTGLAGERNVAFVRAFLAQEGIPLVTSDVLADCARRVSLYPASGLVLCKRLPAARMEIF